MAGLHILRDMESDVADRRLRLPFTQDEIQLALGIAERSEQADGIKRGAYVFADKLTVLIRPEGEDGEDDHFRWIVLGKFKDRDRKKLFGHYPIYAIKWYGEHDGFTYNRTQSSHLQEYPLRHWVTAWQAGELGESKK